MHAMLEGAGKKAGENGNHVATSAWQIAFARFACGLWDTMTTASNGAADKDDEQEEQQEEVTGVRGKANRDLNRMTASQDDHDAMDVTKLDNVRARSCVGRCGIAANRDACVQAVKMISTELRKDREEKQRMYAFWCSALLVRAR